MKYDTLIRHMGDWPLIESNALRLFFPDAKSLSVQLDRWVKAGRLIRLRRGAYLLPEHLRRRPVCVERLANLLHAPSYVSLERALSLHGLIPESVPVCTSITTNRPIHLDTPLGRFAYQHVKPGWFFGFQERPLGTTSALVAGPEKALLDLVVLARGEFTAERIDALRLQNTEMLDPNRLLAMSQKARPRIVRAARRIVRWLEEQRAGFEEL